MKLKIPNLLNPFPSLVEHKATKSSLRRSSPWQHAEPPPKVELILASSTVTLFRQAISGPPGFFWSGLVTEHL